MVEQKLITLVHQGDASWGRNAYLQLVGDKVVFDCSDEEYGPIEFDIESLKEALDKHQTGNAGPKEKAIELYNKYEQLGRDFTRGVSMKEFAKQCASMAVDVIADNGLFTFADKQYWKEVKQEIEKL